MLFCPLSQNITARRHYVSLVCMYTIHKYVLIQSGTQTWDLSKNLHDRILALPLSLPVSLWLSMALSGSLWLPLWLPLALSGSHWLSPCLSLALCDSRWLYLAFTVSLPVSLWLSMALCDSHSGSHWLSLPLSGLIWSSHFCSLISLIHSLIGSQGPCSALSVAAMLTHFFTVWFQPLLITTLQCCH